MSDFVKDKDNALNICSFGGLFSLWYLSQSPAFYIMEKMREFSSINAFLAECADTSIQDFLPEIEIKENKTE